MVEDDVGFQHLVQDAVAPHPDIALLDVASTCRQALDIVRRASHDVLLVDLGLPDGSGLDVIRAASQRWPSCAIMVATTFADERHVMQSLEAGATGYLLKDSCHQGIVDEIRTLHAGGSPINPMIAREILRRFREFRYGALPASVGQPADATADHTQALLSAREREVLDHMTKGFTVEEIASLLAVSRHTVHTFVRRIYRKLEVTSKAEAIYEARQQGLLPR